ncbi:MAG: NAD/NADP octopine/nopaline dehydrogenase family protein [bacterium]|jgi:opine dehydrogenase
MQGSEIEIAVLGAGNGGQAMAAHLANKGMRVALYNREDDRLAPIRAKGGIEMTGTLSGFGRLALVTDDIARAIKGARLIMVVVPAFAHGFIATAVAPHLSDGQIVVLHPGRTGGALEFGHILREAGCRTQPIISEAQTLLYACRIEGPARVNIKSIKRVVEFAALPASENGTVRAALQTVFPEFEPAENVLATGLANIGAVFHPAAFLLNAGAVETGEEFKFYTEGMTPTIVRLIGSIDRERVAVANRYGVGALSAKEWLRRSYEVQGDSLHEMIIRNKAYRGINAPKTLQHRYVFEDIPTGLVPIIALGEAAGLKLPAARAIVAMADALYRRDFAAEGRSLAKLGLQGLGRDEILELVNKRGIG